MTKNAQKHTQSVMYSTLPDKFRVYTAFISCIKESKKRTNAAFMYSYLYEAALANGGKELTVTLNQLTEAWNSIRTTVYKSLCILEEEGMIKITLLDPEGKEYQDGDSGKGKGSKAVLRRIKLLVDLEEAKATAQKNNKQRKEREETLRKRASKEEEKTSEAVLGSSSGFTLEYFWMHTRDDRSLIGTLNAYIKTAYEMGIEALPTRNIIFDLNLEHGGGSANAIRKYIKEADYPRTHLAHNVSLLLSNITEEQTKKLWPEVHYEREVAKKIKESKEKAAKAEAEVEAKKVEVKTLRLKRPIKSQKESSKEPRIFYLKRRK